MATDRIREFPKDGRLWWVKWVDRYHVPKGATATPSVEVLLSPLDAPLSQLRKIDTKSLVANPSPQDQRIQTTIPVFTGFIPKLPLGAVFRDGIEVATLPLQEASFDISGFKSAVCAVGDELYSKPKWWTFPYRVINRGDYNLKDFPEARKSRAAVIQSKQATIVIPCYEVFRTMYAPHSDIAIAFTSGPWELTRTQVLEPEHTKVRDDGNWQIRLRRRIKSEHLGHLLANLCLTLRGTWAAPTIYAGLLESRGPGYLQAPIPIDFYRLKFRARGFWLDGEPRKFLALQLIEIDWPPTPPLVVLRDNDNTTGATQTPVAKDRPYSKPMAATHIGPDGEIETHSYEDPSAASLVTNFYVPTVIWNNLSEVKTPPKEESFEYLGVGQKESDEGFSQVSPGTEWHGETDSGKSAYSGTPSAQRDLSQRYLEITNMLDRLQSGGAISRWQPTSSPRHSPNAGSLPLWYFPAKITHTNKFLSYGFIDFTNRIRRTALVCEIEIAEAIVYWLEIELGPKDGGRKSLIYTAPKESFTPVTHQLLTIAAVKRGHWPSSKELERASTATAAYAWVHSYIGKPKEGEAGRLNDMRALSAIRKVADMAGNNDESQSNLI